MIRRSLMVLAGAACAAAPIFADKSPPKLPDPPSAITKSLPESVSDLKEFQQHTKTVYKAVLPSVVCLRVGGASGSGVIISKEGLILTAGHVSGEPGKPCQVVFPDGKILKGITLGQNKDIDSGMVKITDGGEFPFCELGDSKSLKKGDWTVAIGHPGGFKDGRSPVLRVGRISEANKNLIQTDNTLVGGDSGGPLFDMKGRVIGIHSRIGPSIAMNIHVPAETYKETWDMLVKGDKVHERLKESEAWLGVRPDDEAKVCRIGDVVEKSPAEKAGLKKDDVVISFDGKQVSTYQDMIGLVKKRKAGDEVPVTILRNGETVELKVKLEKRS